MRNAGKPLPDVPTSGGRMEKRVLSMVFYAGRVAPVLLCSPLALLSRIYPLL
jgi:hypothetical protein